MSSAESNPCEVADETSKKTLCELSIAMDDLDSTEPSTVGCVPPIVGSNNFAAISTDAGDSIHESKVEKSQEVNLHEIPEFLPYPPAPFPSNIYNHGFIQNIKSIYYPQSLILLKQLSIPTVESLSAHKSNDGKSSKKGKKQH